jgi:hypothetical protein
MYQRQPPRRQLVSRSVARFLPIRTFWYARQSLQIQPWM